MLSQVDDDHLFTEKSRLLSAIFFAIALLVLQFHIFFPLLDSFLSENDSFLLENIVFVLDDCESFLQVQFDSFSYRVFVMRLTYHFINYSKN